MKEGPLVRGGSDIKMRRRFYHVVNRRKVKEAELQAKAEPEDDVIYMDPEEIIADLARQDMAGYNNDSYARTGDAEDTIRRWWQEALEAGDIDLVNTIEWLGVGRSAEVYVKARKRESRSE